MLPSIRWRSFPLASSAVCSFVLTSCAFKTKLTKKCGIDRQRRAAERQANELGLKCFHSQHVLYTLSHQMAPLQGHVQLHEGAFNTLDLQREFDSCTRNFHSAPSESTLSDTCVHGPMVLPWQQPHSPTNVLFSNLNISANKPVSLPNSCEFICL